MKRALAVVLGFHQDDKGDWIVELACGHRRHIRHRPPWTNHPWITSAAGRAAKIGQPFECALCPAAPRTGD
jgi:hypothetical protein